MKKGYIFAALTAFCVSVPAFAVAPVPPRACLEADIIPTALDCSGFIAGNLLSGSPADITAQQTELASIGLNWDGDWSAVTKIDSLGGATTVDFSTADKNPLSKFYGDTWVGIHFGGGAGLGSNATGFWKLSAGLAGLESFALNLSSSSGAVLYRTDISPSTSAVPEPAAWAMFILGFGLIGGTMRRRATTVRSALA